MLRSTAIKVFALALVAGTAPPQTLRAHCQVPCGVYDDHARVHALREDAATVLKAIAEIDRLAEQADAQSQNQLVRWVLTKEKHAQRVIDTVSDYFLTQRVKPTQDDYAERLERHHAVILAAMKAKQSASAGAAIGLREAVESLGAYYEPHAHEE